MRWMEEGLWWVMMSKEGDEEGGQENEVDEMVKEELRLVMRTLSTERSEGDGKASERWTRRVDRRGSCCQ